MRKCRMWRASRRLGDPEPPWIRRLGTETRLSDHAPSRRRSSHWPAPRRGPSSTQTERRPVPDWVYVRKELRRRGVTRVLLWEGDLAPPIPMASATPGSAPPLGFRAIWAEGIELLEVAAGTEAVLGSYPLGVHWERMSGSCLASLTSRSTGWRYSPWLRVPPCSCRVSRHSA